MSIYKEFKIVLCQSAKWTMVASALNALTFFKMGADPIYINVATGIDSPIGFQLAAFGMIGLVYLAIISLSFDRDRARKLIDKSKYLTFACGFILLNKMLTPVLFLIAASVISSEWKWIPISALIIAFPFCSLVFLLISLKSIFKGLRREAYHMKPISIV